MTDKQLRVKEAIKQALVEGFAWSWDDVMKRDRSERRVEMRYCVFSVFSELTGAKGEELAEVFDYSRATITRALRVFRDWTECYPRVHALERELYGATFKIIENSQQPIQNSTIMLQAIITGRIGQDAQVKAINGNNYITYSVAHQPKRDDPTTWVNVMERAGSDPSKRVAMLVKGTRILVQGDITLRAWTGRDGNAKLDATIWANRTEVQQFNDREGADQGAPPRPAPAAPAAKADDEGDDLPF